MKPMHRIALMLALGLGLAPAVTAVTTKSIHDNSYGALSQGELKSVALTSDGYLLPTYAREQLGVTGAELVWDAVRMPDGGVICATGHGGKLVRIASGGSTSTLATLPEAELTAVAALDGGAVLVAGAPSGRLYRVAGDSKVTTLTQLPATFVWRLIPDGAGRWLALTGNEGRLFRIEINGTKASVTQLAQLKSRNLLCAWHDAKGEFGPKGAIYLGGQDPGWLYRLNPGERAPEVLFNTGAEEIRGIQPTDEGLALALNNERAPSAQALQLTLRMGGPGAAGLLGGGLTPLPGSQPTPTPTPNPEMNEQAARAMQAAFSPGTNRPTLPGGSRLALLRRNGFVRDLWVSPETPIHDMTRTPAGELLVAAGNAGRVFRVQSLGEFAIVADTREDYVLRLIGAGEDVLLCCARNGVLHKVALRPAAEAVYISRPLDAGVPVRWGNFFVHGEAGEVDRGKHDLKGVRVAFRSGNTGDAEIEQVWSEWSGEVSVKHDSAIPLPTGPARFLQYRITLEGTKAASEAPRIDDVEAFFTEPNGAPIVLEITASMAGPGAVKGPMAPAMAAAMAAAAAGKPSNSAPVDGVQPEGRDARSNPMVFNINWKAADPNNDTLRYALYFKGRDETDWKLIDDELQAPTMTLNVGGVADGYYRFRVTASDELDNPQGEGLGAEKISDELMVDNSDPEFMDLLASPRGDRAVLSCGVRDRWSIISELRVDIDNKDAYPVFPRDGIYDARSESFEWETPPLPAGEHTITLNATDRQGNTATEKVVFRIGGGG